MARLKSDNGGTKSALRQRIMQGTRVGRKAGRRKNNFGLEPLEARQLLAADLIITEIAASNNSVLADQNNDYSDWIELFNNGDEPISLAGMYLTDDAEDLTQWRFPASDPNGALVLDPDEYMIVFASDKNRSIAGSELHTNFRLTSDGEFLGIVAADGTTVIDSHDPFPAQYADTTWGPEQKTLTYDYIGPNAAVSVLLPSSAGQDVPAATWTTPTYNDAAWTNRNFGVGFDGGGELSGLVSANGNISSMQGSTASAYVRSEFTIDGDVPNLDELNLSVNYDDGFIAYLNGTEVARRNAPAGSANYASTATQAHGGILANINVPSFLDGDTRAQFSAVGNGAFSNDRARLTGSGPSANGAMWYKDAIPFGIDYSFSSSFTFDVHTPFGSSSSGGIDGDGTGANGMTFVLQNGGQFQLGNPGGGLGLDGLGADFVAIEFDTFDAATNRGAYDSGDVLPTHIGIDISGLGSVARVAVPRFNGGSQGTNLRYVWVEFDGATQVLDVYFAATNSKPASPTVSTTIDLANHFGGTPSLWAGWTAASGLAPMLSWNTHDVLNWTFQTQSNELGNVTETIDIRNFRSALRSGANVLAFHGLNESAADDDFLLSATLSGAQNNVTFKDSLKFYTSPTPGDPNGQGTDAPSGRVEFSLSGQTFTGSLSLTLTPDEAGDTIRYTTNGTIPDETSPLYTGPITISSSTRVRARSFAEGRAPGAVSSESFVKLAATVASFEGEVFKSNLPILVFDGFGSTTIDNPMGAGTPLLTAVGGLVYDVGSDGYARLSDDPVLRVNAGMRVRGQTSEGFAKKQYAIEFWEDVVDFKITTTNAGDRVTASSAPDEAHEFLGMPSDSDWVINGPYSDKTQLNNFLTFNLYRQIGQYAPRTQLVEVFVNNNGGELDMAADYRGTYVLLEKIKLDGDRVDGGRTETDPVVGQDPSTVGGYIWKKDKDGFGDVNFSTPGGIPLKFHEPDAPNPAQRDWLVGYVNEFESVLNSANFADPVNGYRKYIDVQSWYDTFLMVELTKQIDGYRLSTYYHLNDDGKITQGPAWDYNLSFANANYLQGGRWDTWYYTQVGGADFPFWPRLFQDPAFVDGLHDRWFELRETTFSWESLSGLIDDSVNELTNGNPINSSSPLPGQGSNPISRNFNRWGTLNAYLWPNCYFPGNTTVDQCGNSPLPVDKTPNGVPNSYDDYIYIMKNFVQNRLTWIDSQFGLPPELSLKGGIVPKNSVLEITTDRPGDIYYTTDGTDPQQEQQIVEDRATVLASGAAAKFLVPSSSTLIQACTPVGVSVPNPTRCFINPAYTEGTHSESWSTGTTALGFDSGDGNFTSSIDTNIPGMQGNNASAYIRIPFELTAQQLAESLRWEMNVTYDDGFTAYLWYGALNTPVEITRQNAPGTAAVLPIRPIAYNAAAVTDRSDSAATTTQTIDITNRKSYLRVGTNYLVVQLLNSAASSNDALFDVEINYITEHVEFPENVQQYTGPITLDRNQVVTSRIYDDATDTWSSRSRAAYFVDVPPIVVTELNYNPADPTASEEAAGYVDNDDFEFIEIMNVGDEAYDLTGVTITAGVDFSFTSGSLAPGQRGVIVRNPDAFAMRYPGVTTIGTWFDSDVPGNTDALSNSGEQITINGPIGEPTMDFAYSDTWYDLTDGGGFSLEIRDPNADPSTWGNPNSWRPSDTQGGTPGVANPGLVPLPGALVINELVANSTTGDALELRNTTGSAINIGSYQLTDDSENPDKWILPVGTSVPANGYLVINSGTVAGFSLPDTGGRIVLQAANAAGVALGFRESRNFAAADPNVSEGRYVNSVGNVDFVPLVSATLGSANSAPKIGPLVINEIMYSPAGGGPEWIEIYNSSASPISLGANGYAFTQGLDFDFPADATIDGRGYALLVQGTDGGDAVATIASFRAANGVSEGVPIYVFEPTINGNLNNAGEDVSLGRRVGEGAAVQVDFIEYSNDAPWPAQTDGEGPSLTRISATTYGNEPTNWGTGRVGGTPGADNGFRDTTPPSVPQNVRGNQEDATTVVVAWDPSTDAQSGIESYNIYKDGQYFASTPVARFTDSVQFTSSAPIVYRVSAVNGDGVESNVSTSNATFSVQSVDFQEGVNGYTGTQDVEIRTGTGAPSAIQSINVDGDDAGKTYGLVKWENLVLPQGANVVGVTIQLAIFDAGSVYNMYEVLQSWNESQATWANRLTGVPWNTPGALGNGTDMGDLVGVVSQSEIPLTAEGVAMVLGWINDPASNHGVVVNDIGTGGTDGIDFRTKEYATETDRPKLSILFAEPPTPSDEGDLNVDGVVDSEDIDLLYDAVAANSTDSGFDLNGDSSLNQADVDYLVRTVLGTEYGDANLDGSIDATDATLVGGNLFTSGNWAGGDFDGDGLIDGHDFNLLNRYKFTTQAGGAAAAARTPRAPLAAQAGLSQGILAESTGRTVKPITTTVNVQQFGAAEHIRYTNSELVRLVQRPSNSVRSLVRARDAVDSLVIDQTGTSVEDAFANWGL